MTMSNVGEISHKDVLPTYNLRVPYVQDRLICEPKVVQLHTGTPFGDITILFSWDFIIYTQVYGPKSWGLRKHSTVPIPRFCFVFVFVFFFSH